MRHRKTIILSAVLVLGIGIFTGVYRKKSSEAPVITSVRILDQDLEPLTETDGWIKLEAKNFIEVKLRGKYTRIEYYIEPVEETAGMIAESSEISGANGVTEAEPVVPRTSEYYSGRRLIASLPPDWQIFSGPVFLLGRHQERMLLELEPGFKGYVWVIIYNEDIARTSNTEVLRQNVFYE